MLAVIITIILLVCFSPTALEGIVSWFSLCERKLTDCLAAHRLGGEVCVGVVLDLLRLGKECFDFVIFCVCFLIGC